MGCAGRLLALLILLGIVSIAWLRGPDIRDHVGSNSTPSETADASAELAASALERYEAVVSGEVERAVFSALEIESLLLYPGSESLPEGLEGVRVRFAGGEAHIDLRVAFDLLPDLHELERVRQVLPGAVPLTLRGALLTVNGDEAVFLVRRIDAVGVPLPRRLFPSVLGAVVPTDRPELPTEALPLPLPGGIGSVYIDGDRLVLVGSS